MHMQIAFRINFMHIGQMHQNLPFTLESLSARTTDMRPDRARNFKTIMFNELTILVEHPLAVNALPLQCFVCLRVTLEHQLRLEGHLAGHAAELGFARLAVVRELISHIRLIAIPAYIYLHIQNRSIRANCMRV